MSSNPTHGYDTSTGNSNANANNEGVIPAVLNYVGLNNNNNATGTGAASDATSEPAFGAAVGPNSSSSGTRDGYVPAPTLNPHDEDRAKVVADRAVGGTSSTYSPNEGGIRADSRVGDSNLGGSSSGSGIGSGVGTGIGSGNTSSNYGSNEGGIGSGAGAGYGSSGTSSGYGANEGGIRADSRVGDSNLGGSSSYGSGTGSQGGIGSGIAATVGSALGYGSQRQSDTSSGSALDSDRHCESGVGSGVGLGSERSGSNVPGSGSIAAGDELTAGHKGNRAAAGESEGATAGEARASAEQHSSHDRKPGKLENKSAIPVAGGIQLGEKHWGESDIIPDNPRPRDQGVSSASGQPDQSTRDNTAANAGSASSPGTGEQKEGIMDKVKDKLHIGSDNK